MIKLLICLIWGHKHWEWVCIKYDGKVAYLPKSISFAKMDQTEFDQFFDRTVELVCKHFLPGVRDEDLRREVLEMVGS